jgi:IMP dehydrogenase/GMP reductase
MKVTKGYDFDDLLLVPKVSIINSRDDVDLSVTLDTLKLRIPIIASPMKGIISPELMIEISKLGGIGILHRFFERDTHENYQDVVDAIKSIRDECKNWGISLALNDKWYNMLLDYSPAIMCIDVANGNIDSLRKYAHDIKSAISLYNYKTLLMTGNVATYDAARKLADSGVDMIRVGIGNGALCTTRNITGVGIPQLTALDNCGNIDAYIVCDGGIRNSGDAVKALAMGADLIMMGTPFARTYESANNGIIYGQASRKLQEEYYHSVKSVEGLEKEVEKDISLKDFISEFTWGMRSAFTYLNAKDIKELQKNATWVETGTGSIKKLA